MKADPPEDKTGKWDNAPFEESFHRITVPVKEFIHHKASGGIVLFVFSALALLAINSPLAETYLNFIHTPLALKIGEWKLEETLQLWVNDGLMAIFFLAVGLEIKREILFGELSSPRKAALPILAALGGVIVPATIYLAMNPAPIESRGWAIPVATDIAFAVGALALLGDRVSRQLYMFLITLAIVDDLVAVMIIAVAYTDTIHAEYLVKAGLIMAMLVAFNLIGIRKSLLYYIGGLFLWFAVLKSGVHATMSGILLAIVIPARAKVKPTHIGRMIKQLADRILELLDIYESKNEKTGDPRESAEQHAVISVFYKGIRLVESPLHRMQDELRMLVAFVVMPVFAFVNAGIPLDIASIESEFPHPVGVGVAIGLLLGKMTGISLASLAAVRFGFATLPEGIGMKHIFGVSLLAGIGFTMSMFIAGLGFREAPVLLLEAKMGILFGSIVAGSAGLFFLHRIFAQDKDL